MGRTQWGNVVKDVQWRAVRKAVPQKSDRKISRSHDASSFNQLIWFQVCFRCVFWLSFIIIRLWITPTPLRRVREHKFFLPRVANKSHQYSSNIRILQHYEEINLVSIRWNNTFLNVYLSNSVNGTFFLYCSRRKQLLFSVPLVFKSAAKNDFIFRAPSDCNRLPLNIQSITSSHSFKAALSSYYRIRSTKNTSTKALWC